MNDKTVVRPRPGKRNTAAPIKPKDPSQAQKNEDQTQINENINHGSKQAAILTITENDIVDCADMVLSLCCQLKATKEYKDVTTLKVQSIELIKLYEQSLRLKGVLPSLIEHARYCLCCFLDEVVLNQPWGENSHWASNSLLSTFHTQTNGGEHFFILLDSFLNEGEQKIELLELMYLCLSLGFVGKMRMDTAGDSKIEDYKEQAYRKIKSKKRTYTKDLAPQWQDKIAKGTELTEGFPIWLILLLSAVLLSSIYMIFSYKINDYSSDIYKDLNSLVPWEATKEQALENLSSDEAIELQQILQTEINMELLQVEQLSDRLRIRIGAGVLFASGSTTARKDFEPVLAKIARAIESTKGKVFISGHTDDTPIFTTKYPSNWHLSLARATSIGNYLAKNANLEGRIWPEGRGESEPLVANDSQSNKAINRRIEIDILLK